MVYKNNKNKSKIEFPSVTVVLPTMNRQKSLKETLFSLYNMNYPRKQLEVLVIDNGSRDKTSEMVKKYFPRITLITLPENIGFAPALNLGIEHSKGKYIFITNDDVIFDKQCLKELVKLAQNDKTIGIVGGKMFFRDQPDIVALPGFRVNIWLGYHPYDFEGAESVRKMDVATGGCMLIRRSMLDITGPFDPGFFFCGEDYDLCFRAKTTGFKVMYCPTALLWHEFAGSGQQTNESLFAHYRGKFRFMLIHATPLQILVFSPIQVVAGRRHLGPISSAFVWNLKNLQSTLQSRNNVAQLKRRTFSHR
ncbi:glycosyltransferase family 2 protein [Candidatus Microgenomates bacterium]|nr:glycosyltransferase family 2 protein [Candidatus Microgenomates bacterium]